VGLGLLYEASRSHSDTPHSVGLLCTSDQPDVETSTWQHTTLTTDRHPCSRRDSNPQIPAKLSPYTGRTLGSATHPSNHAQRCLTTMIEREPAFLTCVADDFGNRQQSHSKQVYSCVTLTISNSYLLSEPRQIRWMLHIQMCYLYSMQRAVCVGMLRTAKYSTKFCDPRNFVLRLNLLTHLILVHSCPIQTLN
jgi:hypothetical protein